MRIAGVTIGRVTPEEIGRALDEARAAEVTYDHVGSTLAPDQWPDRSPYIRQRVLGLGPEDFAAATERLRAWAPQQGIGATVYPPDAPIELGTTIVVELRRGPVAVLVPDRIVAVVDEPQRFGFAYGTLPGHAETGEESFLIELTDEDVVTGTVSVDASPGTLPARLATPAVLRIQRWAVVRYLDALVVA